MYRNSTTNVCRRRLYKNRVNIPIFCLDFDDWYVIILIRVKGCGCMKKIKYLILLCLVCFPFSVAAQQYEITNYHIDVTVNENNIYNVSEYYNVMFVEKGSFVRKISLRPEIHLSNGKFITYITKVMNFNSSEKSTIKENSKTYEVTIPESYVNASETIFLSYDYNMGDDLDNENDIVFINILDGTFVPLKDGTSFVVTLPSTVEKEDISFYVNGSKVTNEETITYSVTDNYIEGSINYDIEIGDTVAIQAILPNHYFKEAVSNENSTNYLLLIIPIITFIVSLRLTNKYKKQKPKIIEDIFAISNSFDSVEMAYLYKGKINSVDLISLIFKLANDGYILFKNYGSKDNVTFKIKKIKEYDKDNAAQKIVFDGLFQNKEEIDIRDIEGVFYPYYVDARRTLENSKNKDKLFYRHAKKLKVVILLLSYMSFVLLHINPLYNLLDSYVFATILAVILSMICVISFQFKNKILRVLLPIISAIIFAVNFYVLLDFRMNLIIYSTGFILSAITLYIESIIPIRTPYGSQIHYEIDSFRLGLASMSDETFELMIEANSNYFFDMIPYMIIFDLTGWWFNRFASKIITPPTWYESSEVYTQEKILEFIKEAIYQLTVSVQTNRMYTDELLNQAPNKLL